MLHKTKPLFYPVRLPAKPWLAGITVLKTPHSNSKMSQGMGLDEQSGLLCLPCWLVLEGPVEKILTQDPWLLFEAGLGISVTPIGPLVLPTRIQHFPALPGECACPLKLC